MKRQDWSRYREVSQGTPEEYVTYGTVGHSDTSDQYARLEAGRVLVEVTLVPSGEEVIAVLDTAGDFYTPIRYGDRVVVAMPGGSGTSPAIVARTTDASQPYPATAGSVDTAIEGRLPLYGFLSLQAGEALVLATGAAGDILVRSGGSTQLAVDSADQILLSGRTHLGRSATFSSEPIGACVGDDGEVEPGTEGGPYQPAANTNATLPPPGTGDPAGLLPADGLVRIKDAIQSNSTIDPDWWGWLLGFVTVFTSWVPVPNDGGAALSAAITAYIALSPVPTQLASLPASGSRNTCSDG